MDSLKKYVFFSRSRMSLNLNWNFITTPHLFCHHWVCTFSPVGEARVLKKPHQVTLTPTFQMKRELRSYKWGVVARKT